MKPELTLRDIFTSLELSKIIQICKAGGSNMHDQIKKIVTSRIEELNYRSGHKNDPDDVTDFVRTVTMMLIATRTPTK